MFFTTTPYRSRNFKFIFSSECYIITIDRNKLKEFEKNIKKVQIQFEKIGRIISGNVLKFADNSFINIDELKKQNKL